MIAEVTNAGWWAEYVRLLHDPAHLLFELTLMVIIDGLLLSVAYPFIKKAVKRHDEKEHNG